jgi:hypothetical protein
MALRQIDRETYETEDGRYRVWMGHPNQVKVLRPLPQYTYRKTMGGDTILIPQYEHQIACYRTPEGRAYLGEVIAVLDAAQEAYAAQEDADREARYAAEAEAESREWRSPRGLSLTEEMDREDSTY